MKYSFYELVTIVCIALSSNSCIEQGVSIANREIDMSVIEKKYRPAYGEFLAFSSEKQFMELLELMKKNDSIGYMVEEQLEFYSLRLDEENMLPQNKNTHDDGLKIILNPNRYVMLANKLYQYNHNNQQLLLVGNAN